MIAGAERGDVESMVLWDPIINGSRYLRELTKLHQDSTKYYLERSKYRNVDDGHQEVLGFPLTASVHGDLNEIDLLAIKGKPAQNILQIESEEEPSAKLLRKHLQGTGCRVEYQHHVDHRPWLEGEDYNLLVPAKVIQTVVKWVVEVNS